MEFCEKCRKHVEIDIVEKNRSKNIKGEKFQYRVKEAYCKICDSEIYVAKLNDENLASLNNTYRNAKNLIKIDEIKEY